MGEDVTKKSMKTPRKEIARAVKYMQDYKSQKGGNEHGIQKFNNQYVIRIDKGEEICAKLKEVAQKENIKLAYLTGIGAAGKVTAGVLIQRKKYSKAIHGKVILRSFPLVGISIL